MRPPAVASTETAKAANWLDDAFGHSGARRRIPWEQWDTAPLSAPVSAPPPVLVPPLDPPTPSLIMDGFVGCSTFLA